MSPKRCFYFSRRADRRRTAARPPRGGEMPEPAANVIRYETADGRVFAQPRQLSLGQVQRIRALALGQN
ncbi:MAG: hypothetical protein Kow0025_21000 [Thermodesulfovibrionales bacterium]